MNFVVDIETIPRDLRAEPRRIQEYVWERALRRGPESDPPLTLDDYLGARDAEACLAVRRRLELYMTLRPEFGHVICVGMGHDARGRGDLELKAVTAQTVEDEPRLLAEFWDIVRGGRDWRFVTYNGLAFDLPFLVRRSIYLGVAPTTGLPMRPYALDSHFDVMRALSNWERADSVRLDIVAELLGVSKTPKDMEGSQVYGLWQAGRLAEIETYCLGDVRLVYEIFLRIEPYFR
jgi:DNA polymerase elongation subunit (family B)